MNSIKKYFSSLLSGVIVLPLGIYASIPAKAQTTSPNAAPTVIIQTKPVSGGTVIKPSPSSGGIIVNPTPTPIPTSPTNGGTVVNPLPTSNQPLTVTIYQADSQCQTLIAQKIPVANTSSLETVVGKVLQQRDSADFSIAGYRVNLNSATGVATIDLRLSPNARRNFTSLSTCELFALFGSLRQTLIGNPVWKIKGVRFTNQGEELYL